MTTNLRKGTGPFFPINRRGDSVRFFLPSVTAYRVTKDVAMRHFINTITDSIKTVFGIEATGTVVAVMVKRSAMSLARTLLVPFTGLAPVGLLMANPCHLPTADLSASAAIGSEHYCLNRMWHRSGRRPVAFGLGVGSIRS